MTNPYWIEDPDLRKGEVDYLSNPELVFWKDLIDKYLFPIDQDKAEEVRIVDFSAYLISFSRFESAP